MVSLITEKLRRQVLEDDAGSKTEQLPKDLSGDNLLLHQAVKETEHRPVILTQLSPAVIHGDSLETRSQSRGNVCQCLSLEMDLSRVKSLQQSEKTVKDDGKCHLCSLSTEVLLNQTKKRQCHLMSSPDENDQSPWGQSWRPQETSVWRPVSVTADQSRRVLFGCQGRSELAVSVPSMKWSQNSEPHRRSSNSSESPSPILRPSSALSGALENFCNPLHAVGRCTGSTFSPSLSAFSLTGLSLEETQQPCTLLLQCQPQRSHSQPSVLPEWHGFKKRRHDEKRPNLNFIKMKETAYAKRHQSYSRAHNILQFPKCTNPLQMTKCEPVDQSRLFYSLDTIASSPQELASFLTSASPSAECLAPRSCSQTNADDQSDYRESLDSSCSGDFVLCLESESPKDLLVKCKKLKEGIEEEVFDLDRLDDLDIDEIEKD